MTKESLIACLDMIEANIQRGNAKAALLNLAKLRVCLAECECLQPDTSDFPAILKEQAI